MEASTGMLTVLSGLTAALSTSVVALFAVLQVSLIVREHRDRKRAAYNVVWVEWNRIMRAESAWRDESLVKRADNSDLDVSDILPAEWATFSTSLAVLGGNTARYGGCAYTMGRGAVRNCDLLKNLCAMLPPNQRTPQQMHALADTESKAKYLMNQSVLLIEDAMAVIPPWMRKQLIDLGSPKSEVGQSLREEFEKLRPTGCYWGIVPVPSLQSILGSWGLNFNYSR